MRELETTLGAEYDWLDAKLQDLAESIAGEDGARADSPLVQQARQVDQALSGVAYLAHGDDGVGFDGYGEGAGVVVQALNAKRYGQVEDRVEAIRSARDEPGTAPGAESNVFAAMVLVDAPFLDPADLDDAADPLDAKLQALSEQPPGVVQWLELRGNDLTTVSEGNYRGLRERLTDLAASGD